MRKLIIDEITADLPDDFKIALTKQSNDLFDFQNKRSNLSNTIKLPQTKVNDEIFSYASDLTSTGSVNKWYSVKYIQDYEEIISHGRGRLVNNINGYDLIIYWGNVDLVAILGEKSIRDLDLADLNHTWDITNVTEYYNFLHGAVIYPILNTTGGTMPDGTAGDRVDARKLVPAIALSRILSQIETDNSITLGGEIRKYIDDGPLHGGIYEPYVEGNYYIPVKGRDGSIDVGIEQFNEEIVVYNNIIPIPTAGQLLSSDDWIGTTVIDESVLNLELFDEYTAAANVSVVFKASQKLLHVMNTSNIINLVTKVELKLQKFTGGVWTDLITTELETAFTETSPPNPNYYFNTLLFYDLPELSVATALLTGEKLRAVVDMDVDADVNTGVLFLGIKSRFFKAEGFLSISETVLQFSGEYEIAQNLPDIKQIDLIKYLAAKDGLLLNTDSGTNIFNFTSFNNITGTVNDAVDYGEKVDSHEIESYHPELAQENIMRYDNHESVDSLLGRGSIDIDNETLPDSQELYVAPFSATKNEIWTNQDVQIASYPIAPEDLTQDWIDVGARIIRVQPLLVDIYFTDGTNNADVNINYVGIFPAELNFTAIIGQMYNRYIDIMTTYRALNIRMNLNSSEFKDFDLEKLAYIEHLGGYYYVKMVKDYVKNQLTEIKALKV